MQAKTLDAMYANASKRENGIFTLDGYYYSVSNKRPRYVACKISGEIHEIVHGFLVERGKVRSYEALKTVQKLHKRKEPANDQ